MIIQRNTTSCVKKAVFYMASFLPACFGIIFIADILASAGCNGFHPAIIVVDIGAYFGVNGLCMFSAEIIVCIINIRVGVCRG